MDADLNGDINAVDINFILNALAKFMRFFYEIPQPVVSSPCIVRIDALFLDDSGFVVTDVATTSILFEAATASGSSISVVTGQFHNTSDNGIVLSMAQTGNGSFSGAVELAHVDIIQFVIMAETYTDTGDTDDLRRFPWYGTDYGVYGDAGFFFNSIAEL